MKNVRIKYSPTRLGIYESLLREKLEESKAPEKQKAVLRGMARELAATKKRREDEYKALQEGEAVRIREPRIEFTPEELHEYAQLLREAIPVSAEEEEILPLMREDLEKAKARAEGHRHPLKPRETKREKSPRQDTAAKLVTFRFPLEKVRFCRQLFWEKGAQLEADILAGRVEESEALAQQSMISDILSQWDAALRKTGGLD